MSHEAQPITAAAFAAALIDLPGENLYTKAAELRNSIAHLERSNAQLQEYSDSVADQQPGHPGDEDCLQAIRENLVVINRQKERIQLLREEVERRGGRWHEVGTGEDVHGDLDAEQGDEDEDDEDDEEEGVNGHRNMDGVVSESESTPGLTRASTMETTTSRGGGVGSAGGRFTDEDLRRRLVERMGRDLGEDGDSDGDGGLHL